MFITKLADYQLTYVYAFGIRVHCCNSLLQYVYCIANESLCNVNV